MARCNGADFSQRSIPCCWCEMPDHSLATRSHVGVTQHSTRLGNGCVLDRVMDNPEDAIYAWALGRIGTWTPLFGPLHSVVSPKILSKCLEALFKMDAIRTSAMQAVVQTARLTGDPARGVAPEIRQRALPRLAELRTTPEVLQPLSQVVTPSGAEVVRNFGEPLPPGLELITSTDACCHCQGCRGTRRYLRRAMA